MWRLLKLTNFFVVFFILHHLRRQVVKCATHGLAS
jgi:hypothetical protein